VNKTAALTLVVMLAVAGLAWGQPPQQEQQQSCELDRTIHVKLKYLLYLPQDYQQKSAWPLMLFLHGGGEVGDNLDLIKKNGPPQLVAEGRQFPFIIVSPQWAKGYWWEPFKLAALLDEIVEKYKVDQDRIYLTGLSMGGYGVAS
jgi:predicted peptidase